MSCNSILFFFFFFNDTATTEIYTLSLHDALPISARRCQHAAQPRGGQRQAAADPARPQRPGRRAARRRSEEHTSELQSPCNLVCRLLLEKKNNQRNTSYSERWTHHNVMGYAQLHV